MPEETSEKDSEESKDVKKTEASSTEEKEDPKEEDLDEEDLKALEDGQKIPYSRFKQINESKKALEGKLAEIEQDHKAQLRRLQTELEFLKEKGEEESEDSILDLDESKDIKALKAQISELKETVSSLKSSTSEDRLQTKLDSLSKKYPKADRLAVLGWHRATGQDLEELMEESQSRNTKMVSEELRAIVERKKEKKRQVTTPNLGSGFKIDEKERPKTVKEASKLLRKLIG